jgi:2-polyprenyl-3-methyl-5-hydroxy-6-metoxy-1,4-benzoquinol methylase
MSSENGANGNGNGTAYEATRDAFIDRLLEATINVWDVFTLYLGERLGLYRALAECGPSTSVELAARTGLAERYVREWLEQQAAAGILSVENPGEGAPLRRFRLPSAHAEVLTAKESLNYLGALPQIVVGSVTPIRDVLRAFRNGSGVPYADYGQDLHEGQAGMNRNMFLYQLGPEWLPTMPDVDARLRQDDPPARIADFGCGHGWSSIGIARSYPNARVDGYDLDEPSVTAARRHVGDSGLEDQVQIHLRDAADPALAGRYDLVTAFECVHDMSDPIAALSTMRRLAAAGGTVLIVDERTEERFTPNAGTIERYLYGFSVLHCLPVGLADQPSAATGTVMRPETMERYAREAGFASVELLPIDNPFFNFYRLMG